MLNVPLSASGPTIEDYCGLSPVDDTAYIASTAAIMGRCVFVRTVQSGIMLPARGCQLHHHRQGSNIQDNSVVHIDSGTLPTVIGEYVTVGHGAIVQVVRCRIAPSAWARLC